ncbi:hypothetical protein SERLA73DRAFT_184944 [Serpula lacrymans var. lacrymans S7.3]|uniref:Uncharacterized protein n=2 Tax=Serpula lacrymans var. lacrymans TaxID=341189 RepID=F8Q3S7_SERL3|nr:uncharacterized protein SERLADRAFT_473128 [Serpula lacrymans var. lacrymans S7.9]EGN96783.1 hypothetical protein SERLA73DRAFT_184944 [Serpula lacrymans var. lacrymans S7.3]EGO22383.1 hypothetical protein SERLADRAFT_473128 [Serpula lacrymans var. lacrymans S7.9]
MDSRRELGRVQYVNLGSIVTICAHGRLLVRWDAVRGGEDASEGSVFCRAAIAIYRDRSVATFHERFQTNQGTSPAYQMSTTNWVQWIKRRVKVQKPVPTLEMKR